MPDRPLPELNGKTPLEEASTPNMDEVAKRGACGLLDPVAPGVRPGSDVAHLAILGYDPFACYSGRGGFEALGAGIHVEVGDVVFRCNFATVGESLNVIDRRAGRGETGLDELAALLDGMKLDKMPSTKVIFKRTTGHRAVLILRGGGLSPKVSDSDPGKPGLKVLEVKPLELAPEAKQTAEAVNEFLMKAHKMLEFHEVNKRRIERGELPANAILARGAGTLPALDSLRERYGFESSACIAEVALVKGVCACAGMEIIDAPGSTGLLDTDVRSIGRTALEALREHEFVLANIKGPDVASHDGDIEGKIRMIERIDETVGMLLDGIDPESALFVLTSDHTTPISVRDHSGDPTPIAITGAGIRADDVVKFDERSVVRGGLGRLRGLDLMPVLLDLLGRAKKFGA